MSGQLDMLALGAGLVGPTSDTVVNDLPFSQDPLLIPDTILLPVGVASGLVVGAVADAVTHQLKEIDRVGLVCVCEGVDFIDSRLSRFLPDAILILSHHSDLNSLVLKIPARSGSCFMMSLA